VLVAVQSIPSISPNPERASVLQYATVAVVAAEGVVSRRIAAALESDGLSSASVSASVDQLLATEPQGVPDVAVLGCDAAAPESIAAIRALAKVAPKTRIVVVSRFPAGAGGRHALNAGAAGLVVETDLEQTLAPTLRSVLVGHVCVPQTLRRCAIKPTFSHREKQVLALVVKGFANRQIASELFLAESTVKSHLGSAFQKLGVHSRNEAAALLVDPEEGLGATVLGQRDVLGTTPQDNGW
jgi:DNA-binding NarL/FixJ family response regulator